MRRRRSSLLFVLALCLGLVKLGYVASTSYARCDRAQHIAHLLAAADTGPRRVHPASHDDPAPRSTGAASSGGVVVACGVHVAAAPVRVARARADVAAIVRDPAPRRLADQHSIRPPERPPRG